MPLPTDPPGDVTLDVCCDGIYEVADALLTTAYDALADCVGEACKDVAKFVSVNQPTYTNEGDYLAVWLIELTPTQGRAGRPAIFPRPRAQFGFKLMESGYPRLESTAAGITVPQGDHIDVISLHSYSHMERIIRSVYAQFQSHTLPSGCVCGSPQMGRLRPAPRSGGLAGWLWDLTLEVCW